MSDRITVLMGGFSAEREVSLRSGMAAAAALEKAGYAVATLDVRRDLRGLIAGIEKTNPKVVFNALHGRFGEDGVVQGLLDVMGIPYTHSGRLASALAMDKPVARGIFAAAGLPVAEGRVVAVADLGKGDPLPRPYVIKPLNEGSSVGVLIVRDGDNGPLPEMANWPHGESVLVERFIPGREITVAVMGDRAIGATEITSDRGFYDYAAKYEPGGSRHIVPAPLPPDAYAEALRLGLEAHRALGCRGVSRADLRYDDTRPREPARFCLLEVNTQPGLTETSLVPELAAHAGIAFPELVRWMVENARCDA